MSMLFYSLEMQASKWKEKGVISIGDEDMSSKSSRLRETILEWQDKVGIKFDIEDFESDFETEEENGLEEFD